MTADPVHREPPREQRRRMLSGAVRRVRGLSGSMGARLRPSATRMGIVLAGVLVIALIAVLVHRVADATRGSPVLAVAGVPPELVGAGPVDARFADVMDAMTGAPLTDGNTVRIVASGDETFAALFRDLRGARRSITLQAYYCGPGAVADSLLRILTERARAGVRVLVLGDGFGCGRLLGPWEAPLLAAGAEMAVLRPVHWYSLHKAQHRSHSRFVIVDGTVAWTGGFGIDDKWWSGGGRRPEWRETNARVRGPAARQAQGAFVATWAEATGVLLVGPELFPPDEEGGAPAGTERAEVRAAVLHAGPRLGTTPMDRFLALTMAAARERLYVTNSYFVPSRPMRRMLADAAARGVDVRVLTAGRHTDLRSTRWAGRGYYAELLRAGIRIYEYRDVMMHAKTLVVDDRWASIGSMNFDNRSLRLNDEANLLVLDEALGQAMTRLFLDDLRRSDEITLPAHERRPWRERVLEWGVRVVSPLL